MECTQDVPRRAQDAPRTPQDTPRSGEVGDRFGMETRFPTESPPDLDFGASWARFWEGFWDRILQLLQEICGATPPKRTQDVPKTPQESENEANMEPSWHENPAQINAYVDNLETH